jgi:hypothetical protein
MERHRLQVLDSLQTLGQVQTHSHKQEALDNHPKLASSLQASVNHHKLVNSPHLASRRSQERPLLAKLRSSASRIHSLKHHNRKAHQASVSHLHQVPHLHSDNHQLRVRAQHLVNLLRWGLEIRHRSVSRLHLPTSLIHLVGTSQMDQVLLVNSQCKPMFLVDNQHKPMPLVDNQHKPMPLVENQHKPTPLVDNPYKPTPLVGNQHKPILSDKHHSLPSDSSKVKVQKGMGNH